MSRRAGVLWTRLQNVEIPTSMDASGTSEHTIVRESARKHKGGGMDSGARSPRGHLAVRVWMYGARVLLEGFFLRAARLSLRQCTRSREAS